MIGGLSNYRQALISLRDIDAELKLVIAGNHDVSLDPVWWKDNLDEEDDDDPEEPVKARRLFEDAKQYGVHLFDEGIHSFTLKDGRSFTIFASPFTPAFGGYAFSYLPEDDHFNTGSSTIPEGVDIVMTHGPPLDPSKSDYKLDIGHKGDHCGCTKLFTAIKRSQPRLHCFGHIHEGYGSQMIKWQQEDGGYSIGSLIKDERELVPAKAGETMLLNAAIMNHGDIPNNEPWLVEVEVEHK